MYELDRPVKSFAIANDFVIKMNKVCYKAGKELKPFCLVADKFQQEHGVADFAGFGGMLDGKKTLMQEIAEIRAEELKYGGELTPDVQKTLFYQYLMTISICYVEVEKWKKTQGKSEPTYDKMLVARNPSVIGVWMGEEASVMQQKYGSSVVASNYELGMGVIRYVKLNQSTKGNSVTKPRTFPETGGMKCVPLFMLLAWFSGVSERLKSGIVEFTFLKDNHTERRMCSTLNVDIIRQYYKDEQYVSNMLSGVDTSDNVQGGVAMSTKIHRGYVKIPELGSSIYDSTGVRSLNLARVLACREVQEIDASYIYVSLDSVVENFSDCLDYAVAHGVDINEVYAEFTGGKQGSNVAAMVEEMKMVAMDNAVTLSTQYQRQLHTFLISHPIWFPLYTGTKKQSGDMGMNWGGEQTPIDF